MRSFTLLILLMVPLSTWAESKYEQQLEDYRKRMLTEESVRIQKQRLEEESRYRQQQQVNDLRREQQLMRYQYEMTKTR